MNYMSINAECEKWMNKSAKCECSMFIKKRESVYYGLVFTIKVFCSAHAQ